MTRSRSRSGNVSWGIEVAVRLNVDPKTAVKYMRREVLWPSYRRDQQNHSYHTISEHSLYVAIWCRACGHRYASFIAGICEHVLWQQMESDAYLFGDDGCINM